jgi:hypothetical protein
MNFWSSTIAGWNLMSFWIGRSTRNARFETQMGWICASGCYRQPKIVRAEADRQILASFSLPVQSRMGFELSDEVIA